MANIFGTLNPKGKVGGGEGKSTFFTTTIPTFDNVNHVYVLAKSNVDNGTGATFNTGDLVEYINASGKLDAVFTITAVGSTDLTLSFIASIPPYENGCWILDTTNLTLDSGNYYIGAFSDIDNRNGKEIKVGDILIGTDGNIYTLYEINGNEIVVVLVVNGNGGGGKQLYQHNILLSYTFSKTTKMKVYPITTDKNTAFTNQTFAEYLYNNNFKNKDNCFGINGYANLSGDVYFDGVFSMNGTNIKIYSSKVDSSYDIVNYIEDNFNEL